MDNSAPAPERAARKEGFAHTPAAWVERQERLAARFGLALLLVEGRQPPSLSVVNNNSICRAFQSSPEHAERCQPYCGEAYFRAQEAGAPLFYRCHAGLSCFAAPIEAEGGRQLAVIGGRAFLRGAEYRELVERVRSGELSELLSPELFRNVIFALRHDLEECAEALLAEGELRHTAAETKKLSPVNQHSAAGPEAPTHEDAPAREGDAPREAENEAGTAADTASRGRGESAAPVLGNGPVSSAGGRGAALMEEASRRAVRLLVEEQGVESVALLLRADDHFTVAAATGIFSEQPPQITLKPKQIKLMLGHGGGSIPVPAAGRAGTQHEDPAELFPLLMGGEVKGALLVAGPELSDERREALESFCREQAVVLEIVRLRDELERRTRAASHQHAFAEAINSAHPEEAYTAILRHSAELLRAERGSLLLYDERANELAVRAAVGPRAEVTRTSRVKLGEGVSGIVLREGRPVVVRDVSAVPGLSPAPGERQYKTGSFISYPIFVGGRKVGVLNVTDKAGGGSYDEFDLSLLELIAPQMALAIDRAEWHHKATQFQLLSITDPLTGLVNRRYLEERLNEELERSKRHRFAVSFMMIDIDDFKTYNDRHGHPAGDLALEMTAQCLKAALRSADVAARYGGEEFSVLLPQTGLVEARAIAERVRRQIERAQFPHGKSQPLGAVTVSVGVSTFGPGFDTPAALVAAADKALYLAKSRGKNCVEASEPQLGREPVGETGKGSEREGGKSGGKGPGGGAGHEGRGGKSAGR
jgi:diguanylate cyclase (GGDEF)-like protein